MSRRVKGARGGRRVLGADPPGADLTRRAAK